MDQNIQRQITNAQDLQQGLQEQLDRDGLSTAEQHQLQRELERQQQAEQNLRNA